MKKYLFMALLASFIGIISNPELLAASDSVSVTSISNLGVVETVIEKPVEAEPVVTQVAVAKAAPRVAPAAPAAATPTPARNSITVAGRTLTIVDVDTTLADSGDHVNKIGKLLYGHNSGRVFGNLASLSVGSVFTVTYGGATTTYRVSDIVTYEKNLSTGALQLNGRGNYMKSIMNTARGHSVALMTCAGTSLGGGDATHRLVIYADVI